MNPKKRSQSAGEGRMPMMAPLANAYVPYQLENPPKYEARKGIVRGTLYPGLDLPFMGMVNRKELPVTPKTDLQAMLFAIQELALYLDTHQNDPEALELYKAYQQMYHKAMVEYQNTHHPLSHQMPAQGGRYQWINDPWPWEYAANKEG